MSRIRTIKPSFFLHDKLSSIPPEAQILAAGLLCYADDEGYFSANPKLIEAAIFPLRELSMSTPELLRKLLEIGYINMGQGTDGRQYGNVVNFLEHQQVSHSMKSKIKPLLETSGTTPETSGSDTGKLRPELKGIELNRIEGKAETKSPPLSFSDLKPSEAARMFLEHEEICVPVNQWELSDTEGGLRAVMVQEAIPVYESLQWLLERARRWKKKNDKQIMPGWVRKKLYNEAIPKKVPIPPNPADIRRQQAIDAGVKL